jgi:dimeric dUTPase (all-alpha-NTP-PPase superfamily)
MPDRLEEIFSLQNQLNQRLGIDANEICQDPAKQQQWILNYTRAMGQELAELVDSVPWKWWAKYQTYDPQNAKIEIVDMLHFLVSLAQVMGLDADELHRLYKGKHAVNQQRQDKGYKEKDANDSRHLQGF